MTATVTADFREEYELERTRWLRRRFLWYTGVSSFFLLINTIGAAVIGVLMFGGAPVAAAGTVGLSMLAMALYTGVFYWAWRQLLRLSRPRLIRALYWLIVGAGVVKAAQIPINAELATVMVEAAGATGTPSVSRDWMFSVAALHLFAAILIPWSPREAVMPLLPILGVGAVVVGLSGDTLAVKLTAIALSPLVGLPGVLICWFRQYRFRHKFHYRMLRGRYGELKRELSFARVLHESLFPDPVREGDVRFEYIYEPMRQIGGDYLYSRRTPNGHMHVVIVDVTGHGISAALAVNRLHGEIDRELAEDPEAGPASLLTGLNRYMNLTMAGHSVYATVLVLTIEPGGDTVRWASAGHPPAFMRAVDGTIHQIDSTCIVLGACESGDFETEERSMRFGPGDTIVAYTDGAIESRNQDGKLLGITGLERILAGGVPDARSGWAGSILDAVQAYRHGPAEDDTLIVEVFRPVKLGPESGRAPKRERRMASTAG